jgi:hypothetical protein
MDNMSSGIAAFALREAASHIRAALPKFDVSGKRCECCQLNVATNIEERNQANALGGIVRQLEKLATELTQERRHRPDRAWSGPIPAKDRRMVPWQYPAGGG